mmetsp:Transcript_9519/g.21856  ORF Transcript_9519/g.21856 Transcript_9519/m.21856 type:complete len:206 (+) Transcript_9519:226-843(+)
MPGVIGVAGLDHGCGAAGLVHRGLRLLYVGGVSVGRCHRALVVSGPSVRSAGRCGKAAVLLQSAQPSAHPDLDTRLVGLDCRARRVGSGIAHRRPYPCVHGILHPRVSLPDHGSRICWAVGRRVLVTRSLGHGHHNQGCPTDHSCHDAKAVKVLEEELRRAARQRTKRLDLSCRLRPYPVLEQDLLDLTLLLQPDDRLGEGDEGH